MLQHILINLTETFTAMSYLSYLVALGACVPAASTDVTFKLYPNDSNLAKCPRPEPTSTTFLHSIYWLNIYTTWDKYNMSKFIPHTDEKTAKRGKRTIIIFCLCKLDYDRSGGRVVKVFDSQPGGCGIQPYKGSQP